MGFLAPLAAFVAKVGYTAAALVGAAGAISLGTAYAIGGALLVGGTILASKAFRLFDVEMPKADTDGARTYTTKGTIEPVKIVYGQALVSGPIVYVGVAGTDNQDLYHAIALTAHECESINSLYFDDIEITTAQRDGSGNVTSGIFAPVTDVSGSASTTIVQIETHDGTYGTGGQNVSRSALLGAAFNSDWTANHLGKKIGYIVTKWSLPDSEKAAEVWDKYTPTNIKAIVKGVKNIYDPRDDTSVGANPTSATYQSWSDNPALCLAHYMTDTEFGVGIPVAKIDWQSVADAANDCDVTVSVPGGTEKTFTCNGVAFGTDSHKRNITKLLSSMNGNVMYANGKYYIQAGAFDAATESLNENDLRGPVSIKTSVERSSRFNTIKPIYASPLDNHKMMELPPVTVGNLATSRDNGEVLEKQVQFPFTNGSYMAQRLAHQQVNRSSDQRVLTFPANLKGMRIKVGDRVQVTLSEFGYTNKVFQCIGWQFGEGDAGGVDLTLIEDTASRYTAPASGFYSQKTNDGTINSGFPGVSVPTSLTATGAEKRITVAWTNPVPASSFSRIFVYGGNSNVFASHDKVWQVNTETITEELASGTTRYYWVRAVKYGDGATSGNSALVGPASATASDITADHVEWTDVDNKALGIDITNDTITILDTTGSVTGQDVATSGMDAGITLTDTGGGIVMNAAGAIRSQGRTDVDFSTGSAGYFLGYHSSAYKFGVGNSTENLVWNGSNLTVTGSVNATSGDFSGQVAVGSTAGTITVIDGNDTDYRLFTNATLDTDTNQYLPDDSSFKVGNDGRVFASNITIYNDDGDVLLSPTGLGAAALNDISTTSGSVVSTVGGTVNNSTSEITLTTSSANESFTITSKVALDDNNDLTQYFSGASTSSTANAEAQLTGVDVLIDYYVKADGGNYDSSPNVTKTVTIVNSGTPSSTEIRVGGFDRGSSYGGSLTRYFAIPQDFGGALEIIPNSGSGSSKYVITTASLGSSLFPSAQTYKIKIVMRVVEDGTTTVISGSTAPPSSNNTTTGIYFDGGNSDERHYEITGTGLIKNSDNNFTSGSQNLLASGGTISGSLVVTQDLTVQGTTVTLNTSELAVEDRNITLNFGTGDTSATADGAGITVQDAVNSSTDATLNWTTANDRWEFSHQMKTPSLMVGAKERIDVDCDLNNIRNANISGNVDIAEYIRHTGDTDTNLRFQTDRATLTSGGGAIVDAHSNGSLYLTGSTVQVYGNASISGTLGTGGNIDLNGYGITSDDHAKFYVWRAIDNTSSQNPNYKKIARIVGSQSTRFMITLTGLSGTYSDNQKGSKTEIYGQLNNDNNYDITFTNYDFSATAPAVVEVGYIDINNTTVDVYVKVGSYSELAAYGVVSDGSITPDSTSSSTTTEPTNYTAATSNTIWTDQSFSSTNITQWNTAYTYSQVGHLPLAGGTLTGNVLIGTNSLIMGGDDTYNASLKYTDNGSGDHYVSIFTKHNGTSDETLKLHAQTKIATFSGVIDAGSNGIKARIFGRSATSTAHPNLNVWDYNHGDYPGHVHIVANSQGTDGTTPAGQIRFYVYDGTNWNLPLTIAKDSSASFSGNVSASGYIYSPTYVQTATAYFSANLNVLNSAGNGWHTWATRSSGNYNLDVGTIAWSGGSSANANTAYGAVNATNLADTSTSLVSFTQDSDWGKVNHYQNMIRGTAVDSSVVGTPKSASYWYYAVTGKRDTGGGTAGLLTNYDGTDIYFGVNNTGGAPTWYQLWSSYDFNKDGVNFYKGNLTNPTLDWNNYGNAAGQFGHIEIYDGTAFNTSGRHTNYPNDTIAGTSTVPYSYGTLTYSRGSSHNYQMWSNHYSSAGNGLWYRTGWSNSWFDWVRIWDSGNDSALAKIPVANTFTAVNTFNATVNVNSTLNANDGIFGVNNQADEGIYLKSNDGTGGYARIRHLEGSSGSNRQTIHFFTRGWQNSNIATSSTGTINLDGDYGVSFGAWNANDGYVDTGGFHTGSGKHYYIGSTTVLNNLRELQNITKLNTYTITKPNLLQWTGLTAYAYDTTNGVRHYWHKIATMPTNGGMLEVEVSTKSDVNYPHAASAKIWVSSWNATSISAWIDRYTGKYGATAEIQVWLDNDRNVWLRATSTWSSYLEYCIVKNNGVTIPTLSSVLTQPSNSIEIDRGGLGYRFLQSNVAGGANNYYSYPKEHYEFDANNAYLVNGVSVIASNRTASFVGVTSAGSMAINNGDMLIGDLANTNTGSLYLRGTIANKEARLFCSNGNLHMDSASGNHMYLNYYNGTNIYFGNSASDASIDSSGNGTFAGNVTAYGSPSDITLKESIQTIPDALDKVAQLRGVLFTYKKDGSRSTGLIAQELQKVLPEVVYTYEDLEDQSEHLAVRYGNVAGLLVESIKELKKENDELRAMLAQIMEKLNGDH